MKYKMIVLDFDGTLLEDATSKIPESTKELLNTLKNKGIIIVLASGRGFNSALKICENGYFANYLSTDSGAILYDLDNKKLIENYFLDKDELKNIIKYGIEEDCSNMTIYCLDNTFQYYKRGNKRDDYIQINKDTDIEKEIINATHIYMNFDNREKVINFVDKYKDIFKNIKIEERTDSSKNKSWVEITNNNVNKLKSIIKTCNLNNIDINDTIAFGDSNNDIDIIQGCGFGVAMKNSQPALLKIADDITLFTNNEKGVEKYLESIIKE